LPGDRDDSDSAVLFVWKMAATCLFFLCLGLALPLFMKQSAALETMRETIVVKETDPRKLNVTPPIQFKDSNISFREAPSHGTRAANGSSVRTDFIVPHQVIPIVRSSSPIASLANHPVASDFAETSRKLRSESRPTPLLPMNSGQIAKEVSTSNCRGSFGTRIHWAKSPAVADIVARHADRLVFEMHISGNFEDENFT
jgi:hypothetical protein